VDVYYKKHGYPPGYRFQNSNFSHGNIIAQEDIAGGQYHNKNIGSGDFRINQSQFKILSDFLKNVSVSNSQAQVNQIGSIFVDPKDQNYAITSNQNRFQNFIFNKHAWILDSGATDHVCFDISNFTSYILNPLLLKFLTEILSLPPTLVQSFSTINLF